MKNILFFLFMLVSSASASTDEKRIARLSEDLSNFALKNLKLPEDIGWKSGVCLDTTGRFIAGIFFAEKFHHQKIYALIKEAKRPEKSEFHEVSDFTVDLDKKELTYSKQGVKYTIKADSRGFGMGFFKNNKDLNTVGLTCSAIVFNPKNKKSSSPVDVWPWNLPSEKY